MHAEHYIDQFWCPKECAPHLSHTFMHLVPQSRKAKVCSSQIKCNVRLCTMAIPVAFCCMPEHGEMRQIHIRLLWYCSGTEILHSASLLVSHSPVFSTTVPQNAVPLCFTACHGTRYIAIRDERCDTQNVPNIANTIEESGNPPYCFKPPPHNSPSPPLHSIAWRFNPSIDMSPPLRAVEFRSFFLCSFVVQYPFVCEE